MSSTAYDNLPKEERDRIDAEEAAREKREQAGGYPLCRLPGGNLIGDCAEIAELPYRWTQDLELVSVTVPLPKGTRARDLNVVMQRRKLKVGLGLCW